MSNVEHEATEPLAHDPLIPTAGEAKPIGQIAYEVYCSAIPPQTEAWANLPRAVRQGWQQAAVAACHASDARRGATARGAVDKMRARAIATLQRALAPSTSGEHGIAVVAAKALLELDDSKAMAVALVAESDAKASP
jgi:hypothetical protein